MSLSGNVAGQKNFSEGRKGKKVIAGRKTTKKTMKVLPMIHTRWSFFLPSVRQDRETYSISSGGRGTSYLPRFMISRSVRLIGYRSQDTWDTASLCSTQIFYAGIVTVSLDAARLRNFLPRQNAPQRRAASKNCRRQLLFPEQPKNHSRTRKSFPANFETAVDARKISRTWFVPASRKRGEVVTTSMETKFPLLRSSIFAFGTSAVFCNGAVLLCTTQTKNFFMFGKEMLNFEANCSMAKISTKPVSGESLMFLRRSEEASDSIASEEKKGKLFRKKESGSKEVRVEQIAKNGHKRAEIGRERLWSFWTRKSGAYKQNKNMT